MIDSLLRLFGIQPDAYRVLVRAFWRMSMRAPTSLVAQNVGRTAGAAWKAWILYAFFGLMVCFLAFTGVPRHIYATIVASSALVLIGMAVVADFAVFVMAPGDDEILFHRPIRSRTYLGARLTVAGMHVSILALCYGLLPALTSLEYGSFLYPPLMLLSIVATALFAMLLAFAVYRAGLKLFGSERLDTLLTYLPALFSIMTFVVPQMLIGSLRGGAVERIEPLLDFLPPAWFAAVPEAVLGAHDAGTLLRSALGVLVLPIGYWILVAAMGRGFLEDLMGMIGSRSVGRSARSGDAAALPGHALTARDPERAAGYLLYTGATRSRESRMRAAPVLLMPIAFVLLDVFRPGAPLFTGTLAIYMLGAGAGTLLMMTVFHENYRAAWMYGAVPIERYGRFLAGVVQAMLIRHLLPLFLLLFAVALLRDFSWLTVAACLHAILGGLLSVPFLLGRLESPPFSREFQQSEQTAQMGVYMLSMLIVGFVGALHALVIYFAPWGFLITIPVLLWLNRTWLRGVLRGHDDWPPFPIASPGL